MAASKSQTPAQRITSAVWLRKQIADLITDCDENIQEDLDLADKDDARRDRYLERVESHRHWKRTLERVLRGEPFAEEIAKAMRKAEIPKTLWKAP